MFMTILSCFQTVGGSEIDTDPVIRSAHSTSLVTGPRSYEVYLKPRNKDRFGENLGGESGGRSVYLNNHCYFAIVMRYAADAQVSHARTDDASMRTCPLKSFPHY